MNAPRKGQLLAFRASAVLNGSDDLIWLSDQALGGNAAAASVIGGVMNAVADAMESAAAKAAAMRAAAAAA